MAKPPRYEESVTLSPDIIALEDAAIDRELRLLDLAEKRENAERRNAHRDFRRRTRQATEESLADSREQQQAAQEVCPHRKGGTDQAGMFHGASSNYSVVKHTLPHGPILVLCQRCHKEWSRPERASFETNAEYLLELKEYRRAINFPTDNKPSGAQLFAVAAA